MPTLLSHNDVADPVDPTDDGDDDRMPVQWIQVATFWQPAEAHLARLKLESENIDCQITDENIVATDFLYAPAVGGIKVLVPDFDFEKARELVARHPQPPTIETTSFAACPECGSTNVHRPLLQKMTLWAAIIALMMVGTVALAALALAGFIYYVIMWRPWRCRDCGNVFRREEPRQGFPMDDTVTRSRAAEE